MAREVHFRAKTCGAIIVDWVRGMRTNKSKERVGIGCRAFCMTLGERIEWTRVAIN